VTQRFVSEGWHLMVTLNPQLSPLNSLLWGQNLSGTLGGAGGMSGSLGVFEISKWAAFPDLLAWEFFNEIDNEYAYVEHDDVVAWHRDIGRQSDAGGIVGRADLEDSPSSAKLNRS
jgi:hypothetical protein